MFFILTIIPSIIFFIIGVDWFVYGIGARSQWYYRKQTQEAIDDNKSKFVAIDTGILIVSLLGILIIPIISSCMCCLCTPFYRLKLDKSIGQIWTYVLGLIFLVIFSSYSLSIANEVDSNPQEKLTMILTFHQMLLPLLISQFFCYLSYLFVRCAQFPINCCLLREIKIERIPGFIEMFAFGACVVFKVWGSQCEENSSPNYDIPYNITASIFNEYANFPLIAIVLILVFDILKSVILMLPFCLHSCNSAFSLFRHVKKPSAVGPIVQVVSGACECLPSPLILLLFVPLVVMKILLPMVVVCHCFFHTGKMLYITLKYIDTINKRYRIDFMGLDAYFFWVGFMFVLVAIKGIFQTKKLLNIIRKEWEKGFERIFQVGIKALKKPVKELLEKIMKRGEGEEVEDEKDPIFSNQSPSIQNEGGTEKTPLLVKEEDGESEEEEEEGEKQKSKV